MIGRPESRQKPERRNKMLNTIITCDFCNEAGILNAKITAGKGIFEGGWICATENGWVKIKEKHCCDECKEKLVDKIKVGGGK